MTKKINLFGEDWVEIKIDNYVESSNNYMRVAIGYDYRYFKKAEKFPKVFESQTYKIEVQEDGEIIIYEKRLETYCHFSGEKSHEALRQAIAESDRIRRKEE